MSTEERDPFPQKTEWHFDNCSMLHWEELAADNVDKTRSFVRFVNDEDTSLEVISNQKDLLKILAVPDQWGTWITFQIGESKFTISQEDGTKSFLRALIAGLTRLQEIADFETENPEIR